MNIDVWVLRVSVMVMMYVHKLENFSFIFGMGFQTEALLFCLSLPNICLVCMANCQSVKCRSSLVTLLDLSWDVVFCSWI